MGEKICGIIGYDEIYMKRLVSAMNSNEELMLRTLNFTDLEALKRYLGEHTMDVLIVDGDYDIEGLEVNFQIFLTEDISDNPNKIYKFQSVNSIIKQIIQVLGREEHEALAVKIVGVFSPVCSDSKTLTALSVAKYYGKDYRTLYINFDEFSGLTKELPPQSCDLSDVAYWYRENKSRLEGKLSEAVVKGLFFDYIAAVECPSDISFISTWQWLEIVRFVAEKCDYEIVIIDAGNLMQNPWQIIQLCNKVLIPLGKSIISDYKIKDFEKYLILIGKENLMRKIKYLEYQEVNLKQEDSILSQLENTRLYERAVQELSD